MADWDPVSEMSVRRPAEHDNEMRRSCPVAYSDRWDGFWAVFRHADITRVARETDTFVSAPAQVWPPMDTGAPWLPLQSDPPLHRQYRTPLIRFFRGERVHGFEPRITELANQLIDEFAPRGKADFATEFNLPLAAMGMCLLLGLPEENWKLFVRWLETITTCSVEQDIAGMRKCFEEITAFADNWIAESRANPKDDVVHALRTAEVDGRPLTDNEIHGTFTLLFSAGHTTTADALSTTMIHLTKFPEDRQRLRENPDMLPDAVVEFVRLSAPIRALSRTANRDVTVGDRIIPEGAPVVLMFGAGSRDEEVFDEPDTCILDRDNRKHLSFGTGIHRCLGEELGKMEMKVALRELLRRIPDFELDGDPQPSSWPNNGYYSLPMRFAPAPVRT